jgi:hypothetical protein
MSWPNRKLFLTAKQKSLIHVAKDRLGLSDGEYRDLLWITCRVRSAREIHPRDFAYLMERFAALGFVSDFAARSHGHRQDMATPAQEALIKGLWTELHGGHFDAKHLDAWLFRQFKISALRFVSEEPARKAITALKAWKRRYLPAPERGEE